MIVLPGSFSVRRFVRLLAALAGIACFFMPSASRAQPAQPQASCADLRAHPSKMGRCTETLADGTVITGWYRDGALDRDAEADPTEPTLVKKSPDGAVTQAWYHFGKLDRRSGPAVIVDYANGNHFEYWYQDDRAADSSGGPNVVKTFSDGVIVKDWYENGHVVRQQIIQPLAPTP